MSSLTFGKPLPSPSESWRSSKVTRLGSGLLLGALAVAPAFTSAVHAEGPNRVTDLAAPSRSHSDVPQSFGSIHGTTDALVFELDDAVHGEELWITDGTEAGTRLFQDLAPGRDSSYPQPLGNLPDGRLFFSAGFDLFEGRELWITDGTEEGTERLAVPCPGCLAGIRGAVAGEILIFSAADPEHGNEPWRSDGTPEGTFRIGDLRPGPEDSSIAEITPFGDRAIFRVFDPEIGSEPWGSDGSAEGTLPLGDLCPGECSSDASSFTALGDRVVFTADDGTHGPEPWVSDGTSEGTFLLGDLQPGSSHAAAPFLAELGGRVYGVCSTFDCAFSTDGTIEGTRSAPELAPNGAGASDLRAAIGRLFYRTTPGEMQEIWTSDGTPEGTRRLLTAGNYRPVGEAGGLFYFQAGGVLHATDGSPEGTLPLPGLDIDRDTRELGGRLVFSNDTEADGSELWITDGTPAGSAIVRAFPRVLRGDAFVRELQPRGEELAFLANQTPDVHDTGIWQTDGEAVTLFGTGEYHQLTAVGEQLFTLGNGFPFADQLSIVESQGPIALDTGEAFFLGELTPMGPFLAFSGMSPGQQIWASDGTQEGTRMAIDLFPEWTVSCSSGGLCPPTTPAHFTTVGGALFFSSYDTTHGHLWRSSGTLLTAEPVRSFELGETNLFFPSAPSHLQPLGESLFFVVGTPELGIEPWSSDGTFEGTRLLADLTSGPASSSIRHATALNDRVVFALSSGETRTGEDLYFAGPGGLELLLDPGPTADIHEIVRSGELLYLVIDSLETGRELWISDGTPTGTRLLDLRPGPASTGVANLSPIPGGVFFAATDGETGHEPWVSFGALGNSGPLADLFPGESASSPSAAVVAGDQLYFEADDGIADRELFVADLADLRPTCPPDHICLRDGRFAVRVQWRDFAGEEGVGREVTSSDTTILYWFFEEDNWELMLKVLDGCSFNDHYWVFAAAATDVEYTLEVTDLRNGDTWTHQNPLGQASAAVTDTEALPACP